MVVAQRHGRVMLIGGIHKKWNSITMDKVSCRCKWLRLKLISNSMMFLAMFCTNGALPSSFLLQCKGNALDVNWFLHHLQRSQERKGKAEDRNFVIYLFCFIMEFQITILIRLICKLSQKLSPCSNFNWIIRCPNVDMIILNMTWKNN